MLEAYSQGIKVNAGMSVPFTNTTVSKGRAVEMDGTNSIKLNQCGIYKVSVDASTVADTTIELFKDGVAVPQAQSTGTSMAFTTLAQSNHSNCPCPCCSPTIIQLKTVGTSADFINVNITVVKVA